MSLRIPIRLQRRCGHKLIIAGSFGGIVPKPRRDETLIKAVVRAHCRRRGIKSGRAK